MAVRSADLAERGIGRYSPTEWREHARRCSLRYRLVVVAPTPAEVVAHLGGWLFDMRAAGWEVIVPVSGAAETRPLDILGALALDLGSWPAAAVRDVRPDVLAVAVDTYRADADVLGRLGSGHAETVLWGGEPPAELVHRVSRARHRVSVAGRAFKACALRAARTDAAVVEGAESFWTGSAHAGTRRLLDLAPAG